jgi:hypothetical protein
MLIALALAAATPATTAIDAERAFAADAQKLGQWTAFRKYAASDALMFTPQPVKAHDFLKDRKDPPEAVKWSPSASFISCDGALAVNTGPWTRNGGKAVGYFTTVWTREPDGGWKWNYDGGDTLTSPRDLPAKPLVRQASCDNVERLGPAAIVRPTGTAATTPRGFGRSADGSFFYSWTVTKAGAREFSACLWNGQRFDKVIDDKIAAPRQ